MHFFNQTYCSPLPLSDRRERITSGFPEPGRGEMKWDNHRCGHFKAQLLVMQGSCNFWKTTAGAAAQIGMRIEQRDKDCGKGTNRFCNQGLQLAFQEEDLPGSGRKERSWSLVWSHSQDCPQNSYHPAALCLTRRHRVCDGITEFGKW